MNKEELIEEMKEVIDNPTILDDECGMTDNWSVMNAKECKILLDYINLLEQHIRDINQMVKDNCWYPDVGYANMTSNEVMELVQLLNKINVGCKLYWDDDLQNLYNELIKERKKVKDGKYERTKEN